MTLTRRMALFIASMLLLALGGALIIHTLAARDALQQQQDVRNRDTAAALALALSQQPGDAAALRAVAAAQFDLGHYRQIKLVAGDGKPVFDLQQPTPRPRTPEWFGQLLPMAAADGTALVSAGWRELGTLSVAAHTAWAQESLWNASVQSATLLAGLALLAAVLTAWMLRAWHRPLRATVLQAQALARGQFIEARLPKLPELQELTRSMNTTVRRLRESFAGQAEQVAYLQRQAQLDSLTGLPLRQQFIECMDRRLEHHDGMGLLLVRVTPLEHINDLHGRDAADNVLRQVGGVLARYASSEPDSFAGRLAGPDLALLLPLAGMAADVAPGLLRALREAVQPLGVGAQVCVAASDGVLATSADSALTVATPGLALADAAGGLHVSQPNLAGSAMANLAAWQAQIGEALAENRARLGEYPVLGPQGQLIHLECPLRLQLDPHGEYQPAGKWLPLARRCGLSPKVDLMAIGLALKAISLDMRQRAVNVELASLSSPGFVDEVTSQLLAHPEAAKRLWVEWVETSTRGDWHAAGEATQHWRRHGVRIGVEHAGGAPEQLARLRDLGLDYVKVDARHLRGAALDPRVRAYALSLSGLIRLLGLKALAEGVDSSEDLAMLWQLGFDGATGTALRSAPSASADKPPARGAAPRKPAQSSTHAM
jgi:EAL domain-containing protein (putative c-di-GMP-specific phosphodiesterase class I)/GGDEF domain-containing protein